MKLFLIKVGKSYKTFKRNGFGNGMKIVLMYLGVYLKNIFGVKPGDILFITGGVGDSAFYRSHCQSEELRLHGFSCSNTVMDNPFLLRYADRFKIFIFHRTLLTSKIKRLIEKIKKQDKRIIFDTDDLVFDAQLFHQTDSYRSMNVLEKKQYETGVGEEIIKGDYIKVCTASTSYLAQEIKKLGKEVFISKNKLCNHDLDVADNILKTEKEQRANEIRVGYFSGTISHNKDFATITEVVMKIMEKYSQVRLYLAGYLDIDHEINKFKERIVILPFVPRDKYYENVYKIDINLAPLVKNDPFCEAKSELKFFEAGILKIPTVAVRNQTFSGAITDGENGFLADNTAEWVEKLSRLIEDGNLRREMGEKAREKVLCDYTNRNSHNEEYYNYLRSQL